MRTTEDRPTAAKFRGASRWAAVLASATLVVSAGAGAASADDPGNDSRIGPSGGFPTAEEVEAARNRAADAGQQVASIQAELAVANQRLEAASLAAEQAAEAYNGARWELQQANATLRQAKAAERRANTRIGRQRDKLAGLVSASYEGGGSVNTLDAVLGGKGPEGLMSQLLTYQGATSSMDATLQKYAATATLASVFHDRAEQARDQRRELLVKSAAAKDAAQAAATQAQQAAADISAQKTRLIARMAALQGISVRLASQRQTALEEIERRRQAREAAAAARKAAHAAAVKAAKEAAARQARAAAAAKSADQRPSSSTGSAAPSPAPQPAPPAPAPPAPSPPPAPPAPAPAPPANRNAAAAIAFARAQLGEPYVWAAAGPDAWDCSGLTMGAWRAGGVSLPHYSVAQYEASTPISAGDLLPGDLVFWGTTSSPSSIHHVAMYIGDGLIIHAPRTGRPVEIDSMYYWIPPNFFGRV